MLRKWRRSNTIALERTTRGAIPRQFSGKTCEIAPFGVSKNRIG